MVEFEIEVVEFWLQGGQYFDSIDEYCVVDHPFANEGQKDQYLLLENLQQRKRGFALSVLNVWVQAEFCQFHVLKQDQSTD